MSAGYARPSPVSLSHSRTDPLTLLLVLAQTTPSALTALLLAIRPRLLSRARKVLRDEASAEDVTQDTGLRILLHLKSFDPTISSAWTWVNILFRSALVDWLRHEHVGSCQPLDENEVPADWEDPLAVLDFQEEVERVREAMGRLSPELREVLRLHYFENLTYEQVGKAQNCSTTTALQRDRRGRAQLRWLLGDTD